jgi:hypothetical protein
MLRELARRRARLIREKKRAPADPVQYAHSLGLYVTPQQQAILRALIEPPYCVMVRAAHSVGKTWTAALVASWFHDRYNPGLCLTTAPTLVSVRDLLFRELRKLRPRDPNWLPKDTRLQSSNDHWIHGFTANKPDAFQGRHADKQMIIFDEASGVDVQFWERAMTMINPGRPGHYFFAIYNPYDVSCPAYSYEQSGRFTVLEMSALDHPNVLHGDEVVPGAITRPVVAERIRDECRVLEPEEQRPSNAFEFADTVWVPESPLFEVQVLGRWPSRSTSSVWSDLALTRVQETVEVDPKWLTQIGCDPARFGDDRTAICVRKGRAVVHLESHRGWPLQQTATRLKELAQEWHAPGQKATEVPVLIDAAGLGAGLVEMAGTGPFRHLFVEINSALRSRWETEWPNLRSELWFSSAALAEDGQITMAPLPDDLRQQLMAELRQPVFTLDAIQRRVVEAKQSTKRRLRASPDLADAFNLACMLRGAGGWVERVDGRI